MLTPLVNGDKDSSVVIPKHSTTYNRITDKNVLFISRSRSSVAGKHKKLQQIKNQDDSRAFNRIISGSKTFYQPTKLKAIKDPIQELKFDQKSRKLESKALPSIKTSTKSKA